MAGKIHRQKHSNVIDKTYYVPYFLLSTTQKWEKMRKKKKFFYLAPYNYAPCDANGCIHVTVPLSIAAKESLFRVLMTSSMTSCPVNSPELDELRYSTALSRFPPNCESFSSTTATIRNRNRWYAELMLVLRTMQFVSLCQVEHRTTSRSYHSQISLGDKTPHRVLPIEYS